MWLHALTSVLLYFNVYVNISSMSYYVCLYHCSLSYCVLYFCSAARSDTLLVVVLVFFVTVHVTCHSQHFCSYSLHFMCFVGVLWTYRKMRRRKYLSNSNFLLFSIPWEENYYSWETFLFSLVCHTYDKEHSNWGPNHLSDLHLECTWYKVGKLYQGHIHKRIFLIGIYTRIRSITCTYGDTVPNSEVSWKCPLPMSRGSVFSLSVPNS